MKKLLLSLLFLFSPVSPVSAAPVVEHGGFVGIDQLTVVFGNVLSAAGTLAGFVVLAFLIVGGFRYMTAHGDPKALASARQTLFWAIAGLVFIIASFLIIGFISGFVQIPGLKSFCIPGNPAEGGEVCP